MMRSVYILIVVLLISHSTPGQTDRDQVLQILAEQSECWNRGDIDCFMLGYWQSDSLMFVGSNGVLYGWEATYKRYKKTYPDNESMGQLRFDIIQANPIGSDSYFVVGKFYLDRTIGNLDGHFSLILRRIKGRWLIVSDHTS